METTSHPLQIGFKFAGNPLGESEIIDESQWVTSLDSRLSQAIQSFRIDATVELVSGDHAVSASGRAAIFGVEPDTSMTLGVELSADGDSGLVIDSILLEFSKPLHLKNVFTTIDELSELITDLPSLILPKIELDVNELISKNEILSRAKSYVETNAKNYIDNISESTAWKFLKDAAEKGKFSENLEKSQKVSKQWIGRGIEKAEELLDNAFDGVRLSKIEISTIQSDEEKNLELFVSGEVVINDRFKRSFEHIQRPVSGLPTVDAHLTRVLGLFYLNKDQSSNLSLTLMQMIGKVDGSLSSKLDITPIPLHIVSTQGHDIQLGIHIEQSMELSADLHFLRDGDCFRGDILASLNDETGVLQNQARLELQTSPESMVSFGQAITQGDWLVNLLGRGEDIQGRLELLNGLPLKVDRVSFHAQNDRLQGEIELNLAVDLNPVSGEISWGINTNAHEIRLHGIDLNLDGEVKVSEHQNLCIGAIRANIDELQGNFDIHVCRKDSDDIQIKIHPVVHADAQSSIHVHPLPEFGFHKEQAELSVHGNIEANLVVKAKSQNDEIFVVDYNGSDIRLECQQFQITRDDFSVSGADSVNLYFKILHASQSIAGFSDSLFQLDWQFSSPPTLSFKDKKATLLSEENLDGDICISVSDCGVVHFEKGSGLYDAHFFNAFLFPFQETEKIAQVLEDPGFTRLLKDLAQIVIYPALPEAEGVISRCLHWIKRCKECGITHIAQCIHLQTLALAISLFLFDDDSGVPEIMPSLERINRAEGIDRYKLEELIDRAFPDNEFDGTVKILRWLNRLFTPIPFTAPPVTNYPALCEDPAYIDIISPLPCANELYDGDWKSNNTATQCYRYAAGFSLDQLEWIVENHQSDFTSQQIAKFNRLIDIKRRILSLEPREGTFILQDFNISVFLEALLQAESAVIKRMQENPLPEDNETTRCFRTWLAPADMARLISAGISSRYHGLFVQLNQARLFEILEKRGKTYSMAVFYEIGQRNVRTLVGMLMSFMAQDQSLLRSPVDRVSRLSDLLEITIPRLEEFAPWNIKGDCNYSRAMFDAADVIMQSNDSYNAALLKLQSYRHKIPETQDETSISKSSAASSLSTREYSDLFKQFIEKLHKADELASRILDGYIKDSDINSENQAKAAYQEVIECAANVIDTQKECFELPEFKSFWNRLYEALRIASVEEDILLNHDDARGWFAYHLQISSDMALSLKRAEIIRHIIDLIYARPDDQSTLKNDPLSYFCPRPTKDPVNLTIISAMGVVSYGEAGHELESVFDRLKQDYSIQLVRADTGLFKSLDYNAERIQQVVEKMHTPYVTYGYSQGCANMMRAESLIMAAPPNKRHCLDYLVSRHFLCSAFNGSVHAVCGLEKYRTALIDAEKILRSLSVHYSKQLSLLAIKAIQGILNAPVINMSLSSFESLSPHGLQQISRDAQYALNIPSLETQGAISENIPEALIMMVSHFTKQAGIPNDSQVGIDCAHGYPVYNHNPDVDVLYDESIPSKTLNIHHWSPLDEEIQLAQTPLDYNNFRYRAPRSLFVVPWIESLILLKRVHYL